MFIEVTDNSGYERVINAAHIAQVFPDGDRTAITIVGYKVTVYINMDYEEFMAQFRYLQINNWRAIS